MSKVIIDMSEFIHLEVESVYNHNYYKHKEYGYTILEVCEEQFETLHFYKVDTLNMDTNNEVFLFSCRCDNSVDGCYQGDLGFYWS